MAVNFYAKLKQLFSGCDTSYIEPLSYIKQFLIAESTHSEKIVLLYKKGYSSTPARVKPMKCEALRDESDQLNLTGSPLKDSCNFEQLSESFSEEFSKQNAWKDEEEKYHTISLSDAQAYFNMILTNAEQNTPKCWAICSSDDGDGKTMLLSTQLNENKWRRGILTFEGVVDFGPINLIELEAKHQAIVTKQYGSIEGMIDSYYRLGNDTMLQVSRSTEVNGKMTQSMMTDGNAASKMTLHQLVHIGNVRSIASIFWIQLGILDSIKDTIVSYKETKNRDYLIFKGFGAPGDITEIKQEIHDMLTQPIPIGVAEDEDDVNNHKRITNIDKIVENASRRESGELTDQLWDLLKGCSSYTMLKEAIEHIFSSAAKINVVNMPTSQSHLAQLIRDVSDQRIAIPHLSGSEPLELLLEIGLEKVNKDYEHIFIESKLCTAEELREDKKLSYANGDLNVRKSLKNQFNTNGNGIGGGPPRKTLMHKMSEKMGLNDSKEDVGFKYSQFNLKSIENDLARLGRIHLILEHLIMIKMNLNLENVFTTFLDDLRKPLLPFNVLKEMTIDSREIPVTNPKILSKIDNIPYRQRVHMKSRNRFKIIRNTFYFSVDPIFPPHVFKCIEEYGTKTDIYYAHQLLEIENV